MQRRGSCILKILKLLLGGNTLVEEKQGKAFRVDWTFLCKNNWKKMMKQRSERLKIT
jgi:hypothetical protein